MAKVYYNSITDKIIVIIGPDTQYLFAKYFSKTVILLGDL